MTALTENYEAKRQDGEMIETPVKATEIIYKGALVVDKGDGYAEAAVNGNYTFLGVAVEKGDNSADGAADGDVNVRVYKTGVFQFTKATAVQTDLGAVMYAHDDQTVGTSSTSSYVAVGYCVGIVDSSTIKLRIDLAAK